MQINKIAKEEIRQLPIMLQKSTFKDAESHIFREASSLFIQTHLPVERSTPLRMPDTPQP